MAEERERIDALLNELVSLGACYETATAKESDELNREVQETKDELYAILALPPTPQDAECSCTSSEECDERSGCQFKKARDAEPRAREIVDEWQRYESDSSPRYTLEARDRLIKRIAAALEKR